MFPYPSGSGLHVGHPEGYTATDIMARYWRMNDFDVLHPMGWDAFGLPAEQHAINTGTHPAKTTLENIATFKRQLKSLGFSYDWSRELSTTDPEYVKWTQWIFLKLFKAGLAEQDEVNVNWCSQLGTVLANEEIIDGKSERGGFPVTKLPLRQWILKITKYADRLESDLQGLKWPEGTMSSQKLWIGKSEGLNIKFSAQNTRTWSGCGSNRNIVSIDVFTTRPDTLMGVTYIVLAPEHPLLKSKEVVTEAQESAIDAYIQLASGKSDLDRINVGGKSNKKTGVFTGSFASHPITSEKIPIWIADYVLSTYGTGAVMAVPAHDERDFAFANAFDLPIRQVISSNNYSRENGGKSLESELPYTGEGVLCNSGEDLNGLSSAEAKTAVSKQLATLGKGNAVVSYRLRDWVFSRQRYWGEPFPIYFPVEIHGEDQGNPIDNENCKHTIRYDKPIAVEESELPLLLPDITDFSPGDDPLGILAKAKSWRYFQRDGKWFARETNTMPQWAGSCWYYLRFVDPRNKEKLFDTENAASWLPVDLYVGGQEHAVLHLLYARFWHKVLFDLKIVNHKEPFTSLVHQGMILGSDGDKMSKSKGNVVNPDDVVKEYGADVLRLYLMFMGPLEAVKPWQSTQITGMLRFRDKIYAVLNSGPKYSETCPIELKKDMHKTIKKVTDDIEKMSFNTAISHLMVFLNKLQATPTPRPRECLETFVALVHPFAPHIAEECWEILQSSRPKSEHLDTRKTPGLSYHHWPTYDPELCVESMASVGIQINGKVRGSIDVGLDATQEQVLDLAKGVSKIEKYLEGVDLSRAKIVYVQGRILSITTPSK
jgi:leucyl-tRNA synthetase